MSSQPNTLRDIEDLPDLGITLSDGCRLSARVWRPTDAAEDPVPVILEYLPYRKRDGTTARDALTHPWFAKRGYACVRVDMRGNGDSEGLMEDEYTPQELDDAVEVINWLAAQEWCNGNVGMMGISWGGFNALQVAYLQPEPLKAIITLCSTVDRFADDIHYKGGCLLNENLGWGATMWSYSSKAPDPMLRPNWRKMWMERLENEPFLPSVWLRHQQRDSYWAHGSVCEDFSRLKAKVLAVGGWGDAYKNAVPQLVEQVPGSKGIIGPWVHKYPHFAVPEPRIGFLQEALRWWDRWLRGDPNGAEDDPAYRAYLMDGVRPQTWYTQRDGRWLAESEGAISHLPVETLHLTDTGLSTSDGPLNATVCSPQDCGASAGEYCAIWLGPEMPGDQRRDDAMSACFDTAPLTNGMEIAGMPKLRLTLSSDMPQANIAVRLNHVHPDGASTRITYGVLNLTHRNGHHTQTPLMPGESYEVSVDLDNIAYRVPKGHRLRVAISSAYWPLIWPSPQTSTLNLIKGALDLPIRSTDQNEWTFPPPQAETPWDITTLREGSNRRQTISDQNSGIVTLEIEDDFGLVKDNDHGLIGGGVGRESWSIHPDDPLSARGKCHWTDELGRDDLTLRTETTCEMWSDVTHFYLSARIEAYENDMLVYKRDHTDKIPRDGV